jgi:hypothetical protein
LRTAFIDQPLAEPQARTADGMSNTVNLSRAEFALFRFDVTALTGTGARIGFSIDFSSDDSKWWLAKDVVRTTSVGALSIRIPTFAKYARVRWHIRGTTPSITFSANVAWRE